MCRTIGGVLAAFLLIGLTVGGAEAAGKKKKSGKEEASAPVFYPALPNTPRIQFLATYNGASDIEEKKQGRFLDFVLGEEEAPGKIGKPYGTAMHDKKLFVCDTGQGVVWIVDFEERSFAPIGQKAPGRLNKPIGIAIDDDGTCYVTDTALRRVIVYDDQNRYLRAIGDPETLKPTGIIISGDKLYVSSVDEGTVIVYDKLTGDEQWRIGTIGSKDGQLFLPTNLAMDQAGNLYVSDTGNGRVAQYDSKGLFVRQYGSLDLSIGHFTRPKGVAIDRAGRLYVVDAAYENVQIFDPDAKLLLYFGGPGDQPANINLPADITIDYEHTGLFEDRVAPGYAIEYLIIVTSQFGVNKVNIYGFLAQE